VSELVMVIEDEKEIRDLVRYNLEKAGFRVAAAADGEQGLQQLFASRPDALVLDLMLPGMNGLEIVREVRAEPLTHDLPVLVLSARSAEMDKLLGFEQGADDYMTKPFSPRELVARLRSVLRRAGPVRAHGGHRAEAKIAAHAVVEREERGVAVGRCERRVAFVERQRRLGMRHRRLHDLFHRAFRVSDLGRR